MKNILIKKIIIMLCCFIFIFSLGYYVWAASASDAVKGFDGTVDNVEDAAKMSRTIIGSILSVIRTVAAAVAIVVLVVIACKYILASAGDRADIKKYAVNYVIGALILFSASAIIGIIKEAVDESLK